MSKNNEIPEVDIVVDEQAGVIREVPQQVRKTRSKKGHENRVNVAIRNFQEFFDAFGITEGQKMYRPESERVRIW